MNIYVYDIKFNFDIKFNLQVKCKIGHESNWTLISEAKGRIVYSIHINWCWPYIFVPSKLWCDNQAALHIATNLVFMNKPSKIECHFIREMIQQGLISIEHVRTREQLRDIFTKALNGNRVDYLCNKLGVINICEPTFWVGVLNIQWIY